uniref:Polyketide synthase dehydratase domain-containing protein n=1 Tax=Micromonospora carbonacea TaxID=47853 RepID=A0A7D6CG38_9ACTN|nr:polyketide synthase dehydratase domain-containing protein [Micromonospora carbonacea]
MSNEALIQRSLATIRSLRGQLAESEARRTEPIAVVGMACRFPGGADTPERYWELLRSGRDAIVDVPPDRWSAAEHYDPDPDAPGKAYTMRAGFLREDLHAFDTGFFTISEAEVREMDPQHRLLLETGWEALEAAGLPPNRVPDRRVGVFVGISGSEHAMLPRTAERIGPYTATGSTVSVAVGRIAHTLGLRGPAMAVDTACSSSLVAVHLAMESLRRGEVDAALAGGVNLLLSAGTFLVLSKMRALAPDGRCKVFDAAADGYVRAEGCGMVTLRRLSDALADRSPILAVLRGGAVNHDGHSSGMTVPNGPAQRALITRALTDAGLSADRVGYLEAHGTGTPLGDPIEMEASAAVYGAGRASDNPLRVGAVKSVIGHLEAAAGIAGLIKAVLVLRAGQVPPNAHLTTLNPRIQAGRWAVRFPTSPEPWAAGQDGRVAAVSSFGFSGTNAHVVLAEAPPPGAVAPDADGVDAPARAAYPVPLSARDGAALTALAERLLTHLRAHPDLPLAAVAHTLGAGRVHHPYRLGLVATDTADLVARLDRVGQEPPSVVPAGAGHVALVVGDEPDDPAALVDALRAEPVFVETWASAEQWWRARTGHGFDGAAADPATRAARSFAARVGLARQWEAWGIEPAAVVATGEGDLVAAVVAGVLDPETALANLRHRHGGPAPDGATTPRAPRLRLVCGGTAEHTDPARWSAPPAPVDLPAVLADLATRGYRAVVQIAGAPVAVPAGMVLAPALNGVPVWVALAEGVAALYQGGWDVDWAGYARSGRPELLTLPTYPFQRRPYRTVVSATVSPVAASPTVPAVGAAEPVAPVTVPGRLLSSPLPQRQYEARLNHTVLPELAHTGGVLHVGYYQQMLAQATAEVLHGRDHEVHGMRFAEALHVAPDADRIVQFVLEPADDEGWHDFRVHSRPYDGRVWSSHVHGRMRPHQVPMRPKVTAAARDEIRDRCSGPLTGERFYADLVARGFASGASVELVEEVWAGEGEVLARLRPAPSNTAAAGSMALHPGVLDACAQLIVAAGADRLAPDDLFITVATAEFDLTNRPPRGDVWCHLTLLDDPDEGHLSVDYRLFDADGYFLARAGGLRVRIIPADALKAGQATHEEGATGPAGDAERPALAAELLALPTDARQARIRDHLSTVLGELLRRDAGDVPTTVSIAELGIDSLAGLELRRSVKRDTGVDLAMELIIQGPTVDGLAETLTNLLEPGADPVAGVDGDWYTRDYELDRDRWLAHHRISAAPRVRLFCVPYGVKGASLFSSWTGLFDNDVDVCPVQFPGKENRIHERPISDIDEAVNALEVALDGLLDRPFAIYGHSVGALIAYRLAHRLHQRHGDLLRHLFVGAYTSPSIVPNPVYRRVMESFQAFGFDSIPDIEELATVPKERQRDYERFVEDQFGMEIDDEMRNAIKPVGYSDFRMVHTYRHDPAEPPLPAPISAFHGKEDTFVTEDEMRAWKGLTANAFDLTVLSGDHFFIHPDQDEQALVREIARRLAAE